MSLIQKEPNTALSAAARTPEREHIFKWVGPILNNKWILFAPKDSKIKITSLDDAKKYVVGGYNEDGFTAFLLKNGFTRVANIDVSLNQRSNILKLEKKRIDLWAIGAIQGTWLAKEINIKNIVPLYTVKQIDVYIAFHKDTDDKLINRLNATFEKMKNDSDVLKIYKKYGANRSVDPF